MVHKLRILVVGIAVCRRQRLGRMMAGLLLVAVWSSSAAAQTEPLHYRHSGDMPPGAIGRAQLQRGGPLPGYFQPIEINAPQGASVGFAFGDAFEPTSTSSRQVGMLIGQVYRIKVTQITDYPGLEIYPTVEVIDRIYPPRGMEAQFPIPIQITRQDLLLAAEGQMVTRVIYLEDPQQAVPVAQKRDEQHWFEAAQGDDPLRVADSMGRPVAILRMGGLVPGHNGPDARFLFGSPPLVPLGAVGEFLPCPETVAPAAGYEPAAQAPVHRNAPPRLPLN